MAADPTEAPAGFTKTDRRDQKRDFRAADREQAERTKAALRSEGIDPDTMLPLSPRGSGGSGSASSRPVTVRVRELAKSSAGNTVAGVFLGGAAYFLGLAIYRGGAQGGKAWLAAKFVNRIAVVQNGKVTYLPSAPASGA